MKITLLIDGEEKTFSQPAYMPAIRFKQSVQWAKQLQEDFSNETLEGVVDYISRDLYNSQFTSEEFWNGVDAGDVMQLLMDVVTSPARRAEEKLNVLKN